MSGGTYVDTGILVKGYIKEADFLDAIAILEAAGTPLLFSHIHELETQNAIRLKRFRGEINKEEEVAAIRDVRADLDTGRLVRPEYDLAKVFNRAERLSARFSGEIGTRSLDLLHVAAALEAGCTVFASFDERQRKGASLAGLKVLPVKLPRKRP